MDTHTLEIAYTGYASPEELPAADRELIRQAIESTARSYAPYSHFAVGAALRLESGTVVCGSNQENAAYPSGLCAERTALFYAGANHPQEAVSTLAIAARDREGRLTPQPVVPCGACRQVMLETSLRQGAPFRCLLYGTERILLIPDCRQLLPLAFTAEAMG